MDIKGVRNFSGTDESVDDWLFHFSLLAQSQDWSDESKLKRAPVFLAGPALEWYRGQTLICDTPFTSWKSFKDTITKHFQPPNFKEALWKELLYIKQSAKEGTREYAVRFDHLLKKMTVNTKLPCDLQKYLFIWGLQPDIMTAVKKQSPNTLDDAITAASALSTEERKAPTTVVTTIAKSYTPNEEVETLEKKLNELKLYLGEEASKVCQRCTRTGHLAPDCTMPKCNLCKKFGHVTNACYQAGKGQGRTNLE